MLKQRGFKGSEVSGGCFCCRFRDLIARLKHLIRETDPDVVIGEPVGSCTDLSATVLQPLKKLYGELFRTAPFSVLVDPVRLREAFGIGPRGVFCESVFYIFRKQLEEADSIVVNKIDLLPAAELGELRAALGRCFPGKPLQEISALKGDGVDAWLDFVMRDELGGRQIVDVDYDTYAEGEAVLGWLNAAIEVRSVAGAEWKKFCTHLLRGMQSEFQQRSVEVAHVKLHLSAGGKGVVGNLTGTNGEVLVRDIQGGTAEGAQKATLILNARVQMDPGELRALVEKTLKSCAVAGMAVEVERMESLSPGRPQPTYRFDSIAK